ncbi:MAG: molybdopterin cofactor-binding domain-containing protein, partial [Dongiaceae bacterium]
MQLQAEAKGTNLPRRRFLKGAAGITFALTLPVGPRGLADEAHAAPSPLAPNVWVSIAVDGTIMIVSPSSEMGQGSLTALPVILAEELDADWSKVKIVEPPAWDAKIYGNPKRDSRMSTTGAFSVTGYFTSLRIAGAQMRRVLIDAAAANWGVRAEELVTEPGEAVHRPSGRRVGYGDIARFAR